MAGNISSSDADEPSVEPFDIDRRGVIRAGAFAAAGVSALALPTALAAASGPGIGIDGDGDEEDEPVLEVTGGSIQSSGTSKDHIFAASGLLEVSGGEIEIDYIVVGGGGGGASAQLFAGSDGGAFPGGGGGGGAVLVSSAKTILGPGTYAVTVGEGGAAGKLFGDGSEWAGQDGGSSSLALPGGPVTASGGKGAPTIDNPTNEGVGGASGNGEDGGKGEDGGGDLGAGGGAGAGGKGGDGANGVGGAGGLGALVTGRLSSPVVFGAGGGGGGLTAGGLGGPRAGADSDESAGGDGADPSRAATEPFGFGSGGGGGSYSAAAFTSRAPSDGKGGVVVISYVTP